MTTNHLKWFGRFVDWVRVEWNYYKDQACKWLCMNIRQTYRMECSVCVMHTHIGGGMKRWKGYACHRTWAQFNVSLHIWSVVFASHCSLFKSIYWATTTTTMMMMMNALYFSIHLCIINGHHESHIHNAHTRTRTIHFYFCKEEKNCSILTRAHTDTHRHKQNELKTSKQWNPFRILILNVRSDKELHNSIVTQTIGFVSWSI